MSLENLDGIFGPQVTGQYQSQEHRGRYKDKAMVDYIYKQHQICTSIKSKLIFAKTGRTNGKHG
jgi:hypothetical protein